jgi:hypothetical protein
MSSESRSKSGRRPKSATPPSQARIEAALRLPSPGVAAQPPFGLGKAGFFPPREPGVAKIADGDEVAGS